MNNIMLEVVIGAHTLAGVKPTNQDFHGAIVPSEHLLLSKGIAIAVADGISSSDVSHIASQSVVSGFLNDYFSTSETWSVKKSVQQVLTACNSWLHAQTRQSDYRFEKDRGYVCTFAGLVLKGCAVHLFHIGDSRIYRLRDGHLEKLTEDHRIVVSSEQHYLARAMGMHPHLDMDYQTHEAKLGDVYMLATDGCYGFIDQAVIVKALADAGDDMSVAAQCLVETALKQGSDDNLTVQLLKVMALPPMDINLSLPDQALTFPPSLSARMVFDGYTIIRPLHEHHRSHVYLAVDNETQTRVVLKIPSIELRDDPAYMERFLLEEWIARRIDHPNVLKPCPIKRQRQFIYTAMEYIEGQTLAQWMLDHPKTDLETTRSIIEQIAKGLNAFHRLEILHQDLRPNNIMLDMTGTVKIIDFGSARVAGLEEMANPYLQQAILGTAPYTAPEYFLGEVGTPASDLFSLGVIAYQMITGQLPYGTQIAKIKKPSEIKRLRYEEIRYENIQFPAWADDAIMRAVHPQPAKRYQVLSEFIYDLRHPNQAFLNRTSPPLIERDPLLFWRGLSLFLFVLVMCLLWKIGQLSA